MRPNRIRPVLVVTIAAEVMAAVNRQAQKQKLGRSSCVEALLRRALGMEEAA